MTGDPATPPDAIPVPPPGEEIVHATAVALDPARGVLILGPSGAGKSALALRLMAFGAVLVSDDRVILSIDAGAITARAPAAIRGLIEARGFGLLNAETLDRARIALVVDLGAPPPARLPDRQDFIFQGVSAPLVQAGQCGHVEASILQWLKGGARR